MKFEDFILKKASELGHDFDMQITKVEDGNNTKLVVRILKDKPQKTGAKVIAFSSGKNIHGEANLDAFRESLNKKPKGLKSLICSLIGKAKDEVKRLTIPEEDLDYYVDDQGREYEVRDGIRRYIDSRGFYYFLKYDSNGQEIAWTPLEQNLSGDFIDSERTMIKIDGHVYRMDSEGVINMNEEIFPYKTR